MRIRVNYERPFEICYLGHLDLMRTIERGLRRSRLPLSYSEGFNKRVKIEMGFPLSVGMIGEDEYFDFYLENYVDIDGAQTLLKEVFNGIIKIKRIREISENAKSLTAFDALLVHLVEGKIENEISMFKAAEIIEKIYFTKKIEVLRNGETKEVRRFIDKLFLMNMQEKNLEILFSIYYTRMGSIKISELIDILKQFGLEIKMELVKRMNTLVFYKANLVSPFDID